MVDMCYLRVLIAARLDTSWIKYINIYIYCYYISNIPGVISMAYTSISLSKSILHIATSVSCDVWHEPFANVCVVLPPVVDWYVFPP